MKILGILQLIFLCLSCFSHGDIDRSWSRTDTEIDASFGSAAAQRGALSQHEAIADWKEKIDASINLPPQESIPLLGEAVNKLAKKNIFQVEERIEVYDQARDLLLSTPGHAEYYRDRINEARLKMENSRGDAGDYPYYKNKLREVILYDFPIFEQLPSPETVRVLGEFLFDERGYVRVDNPKDENELFKMIAQGPVFGRAARSLLALPLEHKPVVDTRYPSYTNPEDILPWRQWIEEIKAGKRTFRFVGDPTEYDLNGPASQEKLTRLAMNRERDEERAVGHNRPSSAPEAESAVTRIGKPSTIAGILAGCALVAAAVWYFLRGRKTA